jgi:hypothetical protein
VRKPLRIQRGEKDQDKRGNDKITAATDATEKQDIELRKNVGKGS